MAALLITPQSCKLSKWPLTIELMKNLWYFPQQSTISNDNEGCTTAHNTDEAHKYHVQLNKRNQTIKSICFMIQFI